MARRALIWHLYPVYLLVIIVSLLSVVGFSATSLRAFYIEQVSSDLHSRAVLLQDQVRSHLLTRDDMELQQQCESLGRSSSTRITVVLPSGEVIADSEEHPTSMDNHAGRPEIREAIEGEAGSSIRFSNTLNQQMMYVALPITDSGTKLGVLRVALPITAIEDALWSVSLKILYGTVVVALFAAVASWVVSRRITRPLGELRMGAEKFARGELSHQLITHHSQEIDALADAMNKMANEVDDRMNTVTRQKHEQEAVLSSMVEGVLAVDASGRLISINETAEKLFEIDTATAIGRNAHEVIRNSAFHAFLNDTFQSDNPVEDEITFHLDGERIYIAHGTVLQGMNDESVGAVVVLHDVTRVRRLERMRTDFVSNVSHELRTPVTSIKGFIETLIDNPPSDKAESKRFLEIINKNATQLSTLIEDLLNLSRMEQATEPTKDSMDDIVLMDIVSQAQITCSPSAKKRDVIIEILCEPSMRVKVHASLMQQAISNLIDNAVKYSEKSGKVIVKAIHDDSGFSVQVEDNGAGIGPEHLPRLFERFYRVDKARSREMGGTGLGLAIVKHIAELHGGHVEVQSELGKGSTFTIHIPVS